MSRTQQRPDDISIMRAPISLPCQARVVPGTPDTHAPIELRTEFCAVDAFWMVGRGMLCDLHLHEVFGDDYDEIMDLPEGFELSSVEKLPWSEMHRYPQSEARWSPA